MAHLTCPGPYSYLDCLSSLSTQLCIFWMSTKQKGMGKRREDRYEEHNINPEGWFYLYTNKEGVGCNAFKLALKT